MPSFAVYQWLIEHTGLSSQDVGAYLRRASEYCPTWEAGHRGLLHKFQANITHISTRIADFELHGGGAKLLAWFCAEYPKESAEMELCAPISSAAGQEGTAHEPVRHSPDFGFVHWYGNDYTFTPDQRACVEILWEAMNNGTPEVSHGHLLGRIRAGNNQRLRDVFKESGNQMHLAWNTMIVHGSRRDMVKLAVPEEKTGVPTKSPT